MEQKFKQQLLKARAAAMQVALLDSVQRNIMLCDIARALKKRSEHIITANNKDFANLSDDYPLADRLRLTEERISKMAAAVLAVAVLPDPLGRILEKRTLANKIRLVRLSVPIGVIGVIYEARPDITTEIVSLALKSGNVVVLKGGSEARHTNAAVVAIMHDVLKRHGFPAEIIISIDPSRRDLVKQMMRAYGLVDVLIPRGGQPLIDFVRNNARVPVIETGAGVCHAYVESSANLNWAKAIVVNAKTRRPSVCNALDTLLVDRQVADSFLRQLAPLLAQRKVILRADTVSYKWLKLLYPASLLCHARNLDYGKEFLGLEMAIRVVNGSDEALRHITQHTSHHSEAIVTGNKSLADQFVREVDAAVVYVNLPTSFTDGFEFGLGAEVGISTQKLHARGPMGLEALTSYKWIARGRGQTRPV